MATDFFTFILADTALENGYALVEKWLHEKVDGRNALLFIFEAGEEITSPLNKLYEDFSIPTVGGTASGIFSEKSWLKSGLVLGLLLSDEMQFTVSFGEDLKKNPKEAVKKAFVGLGSPEKNSAFPVETCLMFLDGLSGKGEEAVISLAALFQGVIAGGASGDDLSFFKTEVFCNGSSKEDTVALLKIASKKPFSVSVSHGHKPISESFTITESEGSKLIELDKKPAIEAWEKIWRERGVLDENQSIAALSRADLGKLLLKYEAGLLSGKEHKVRFPLSVNADGSLNFVCSMVEGSEIQIMDCSNASLIESVKEAAKEAKAQLGDKELAGALIFDCACRSMQLEEEFSLAISSIKEVLGDIPILGMETYGEIALKPGDFSGFHNTTAVILLIPR